MKIALLGNMNNNNFSLLRYFRNLGLDAHLLLFKNDGMGHSDHFKVESDTFEIKKWKPYIHQTKISDDIVCAFDFPFSWLLSFRSFIRSIFSKNLTYAPPISKKYLKDLLQDYTHLVGSGITPAMLDRIDKPLTIFFPYAIGVEYYGDHVIKSLTKKKGLLAKHIYKSVINKQKKGIKNSRHIINSERSITESKLVKLGIKSKPIFLPIYYEKFNSKSLDIKKIYSIEQKFKKSSFKVISHVRLFWKKPLNYSEKEWIGQNKNNDRLIRAFARLKMCRPKLKPLLFLFEYGPDIKSTKKLIKKLGIEKTVVWIPKMERKLIYYLISKADVGVGEFYDIKEMIWGLTAVEIMMMGKPVIQAFDYNKAQFMKIYGTTLPPIMSAKTENQIFNHLKFLSNSKKKKLRIGRLSKIWFDNNIGNNCANKWLSLVKN